MAGARLKVDPLRTAHAVAVGAVIILAAALAYNTFRAPYEERWERMLDDVASATLDGGGSLAAAQDDMGDLEAAILARPELWRRLIAPPPPEKEKPDLAKMLRGVTPTRVSIGDKVEIRMNPKDRSGELKIVGDAVKGTRIKEITNNAVVFEVVQDGESYTHRITRQ